MGLAVRRRVVLELLLHVHYIPDHFLTGHSWAGRENKNRFLLYRHVHRGRRFHAAAHGLDGGQMGHAHRVRHAAGMLHHRRVLRRFLEEAGIERCRSGIERCPSHFWPVSAGIGFVFLHSAVDLGLAGPTYRKATLPNPEKKYFFPKMAGLGLTRLRCRLHSVSARQAHRLENQRLVAHTLITHPN